MVPEGNHRKSLLISSGHYRNLYAILNHRSEFLRGFEFICCYSLYPYDFWLSLFTLPVFEVISFSLVANFFPIRKHYANWCLECMPFKWSFRLPLIITCIYHTSHRLLWRSGYCVRESCQICELNMLVSRPFGMQLATRSCAITYILSCLPS